MAYTDALRSSTLTKINTRMATLSKEISDSERLGEDPIKKRLQFRYLSAAERS